MANLGPGGMGMSNQIGGPMQMRQTMGGPPQGMPPGAMVGGMGGTMPMGSPGSVGGVLPPHPGAGPGHMQNQGPPQGQSASQQNAQQEIQLRFDNVARVRMLVGSLKESLSEVVRVAAMNIYHTAAVDNGIRASSEAAPQRLDKALEEFFNLCNQIEFTLKTIQECVLQERASQRYLPIPVQPNRYEPPGHQDMFMSYSQFLSTIGSQIAFAKELHEILTESANRLQQPPPPQPMFH
ncbi:mediator of RNA polymerase II transcription subunit 29 [Galendromus occidentalis]|uniref:Mediator of RNA polymerase II transcription subunit 29 n=1 Tax=Galendromus occidentalis TaxID=34638 RepID=A0AAJ6VWL0_9ACAR|nr:mediator of RNA polymerase II transcription subunit 29 [Galendromus occidentalis]